MKYRNYELEKLPIRHPVISGEGVDLKHIKNHTHVDSGEICKGITFDRLGPNGIYSKFSFGEGDKIGKSVFIKDGVEYKPELGRNFARVIVEKEPSFKGKIKEDEHWLFIPKSEYWLLSHYLIKAMRKTDFDLYKENL